MSLEELKQEKVDPEDKKERKILEGRGWVLIDDKAETITEKRTADEIEDEYLEKNKGKNFFQIELVPKYGSEEIAHYAKPGDSYYVYMRTREEAEKEKARRKEIRKELVKTINESLKEIGFKKDKKDTSTWQRKLDEQVQVFNLQTHRFSHEYFINLGILMRGRDKTTENPKEWQCHHRFRLDQFMSKDEQIDYNEAMDFEAIPNEFEGKPPELEQIEKIKGYIEKYAAPFFKASREI